MDDIRPPEVCSKNGELLAVEEFNNENTLRSIEIDPFFATRRIFKNASWICQMRSINIIDHPSRQIQRKFKDLESQIDADTNNHNYEIQYTENELTKRLILETII